MHNGILVVIGFKVFECGGWVEDGFLVPSTPPPNEFRGIHMMEVTDFALKAQSINVDA